MVFVQKKNDLDENHYGWTKKILTQGAVKCCCFWIETSFYYMAGQVKEVALW